MKKIFFLISIAAIVGIFFTLPISVNADNGNPAITGITINQPATSFRSGGTITATITGTLSAPELNDIGWSIGWSGISKRYLSIRYQRITDANNLPDLTTSSFWGNSSNSGPCDLASSTATFTCTITGLDTSTLLYGGYAIQIGSAENKLGFAGVWNSKLNSSWTPYNTGSQIINIGLDGSSDSPTYKDGPDATIKSTVVGTTINISGSFNSTAVNSLRNGATTNLPVIKYSATTPVQVNGATYDIAPLDQEVPLSVTQDNQTDPFTATITGLAAGKSYVFYISNSAISSDGGTSSTQIFSPFEKVSITGASNQAAYSLTATTAAQTITSTISSPSWDTTSTYQIQLGIATPPSTGGVNYSCVLSTDPTMLSGDLTAPAGGTGTITYTSGALPSGHYCVGLRSKTTVAGGVGTYSNVVVKQPVGINFDTIIDLNTASIPGANLLSQGSTSGYGCTYDSTNKTYCMLAPLPGIGDATGKIDVSAGVGPYIKELIWIIMGLIGILSVLMVVVGGIEYMSTVNIGEKEGAKERITNAIFGLILALGSYIILNTINPNLVNLNVSVAPLNYSLDSSTTFIPTAQATTSTSTNTGETLSGICQAYTGNVDCEGNTTKCTQYSARVDALVSDTSMRQFMKANMVEESACIITATSSAGAYGIFQQLPSTAQTFASSCGVSGTIDQSWLTNESNIDKDICIQQKFIQSLQNSCGTNWRNIAAAEDAGPGWCAASADCQGLASCVPNNPVQAWECPYNDPSHTTFNTGLTEARNAQKKIMYCIANPGSWDK